MRQPVEPEPEPSITHSKQYVKEMADKFLAAQAERINNQYTIDGKRIGSSRATPRITIDTTNQVELLEDAPSVALSPEESVSVDRLSALVITLRERYFEALKTDTWYDPMDDESSVEKGGINSLTQAEQEFVREYLQHLRELTKPKGAHATDTPHDTIVEYEASRGKHAVQLVREKGRRALQLNGEGVPQEQ